MKKQNYVLPLLAGLFILTACEDEDYRDPSAIVGDYISEHQQLLTSSVDGWRFDYSPTEGVYGAFTFMMKFHENGRVTMQTDENFHYLFATEDEKQEGYGSRESDYTIQNTQGPVLTFATYSLLSKLADPELNESGSGWGGENDFIIMGHSAEGDTIYLKGLKNQKRCNLIKNTQNWDTYFASVNAVIRDFADETATNGFFRDIVVGGQNAVMTQFSTTTRCGVVYQYEGGKMVADTCLLKFTPEGATLISPLQIGETMVTHFAYKNSKEFLINGVEGSTIKMAENGRPKMAFQVKDKVFLGKYTYEEDGVELSETDSYMLWVAPTSSDSIGYELTDSLVNYYGLAIVPNDAGKYYACLYDEYTSESGQSLMAIAQCGFSHQWVSGVEDEILFRGVDGQSNMAFVAENPETGSYDASSELATQYKNRIQNVYYKYLEAIFGATRARVRCVVVPSPDNTKIYFVNKENGECLTLMKI